MYRRDVEFSFIQGEDRRIMTDGQTNRGTQSGLRVIVAGGGTGGHLFPGLAIAEEICRRDIEADILFVTGGRKIESDILSQAGFHQVSIMVEGIKGRGLGRSFLAMLKVPVSLLQSMRILQKFSPHLVLGVGGYSAGPVCAAARMLGRPTAIHEQNSFPGLTNRMLGTMVNRVFISFEESRRWFRGGKAILTGNPIRQELLNPSATGPKREEGFTILVVGGSQGAQAINRAVVGALSLLKDQGREPQVIHQTGQADESAVRESYRRLGMKGEISPFIADMRGAYSRSDMVVSRAGATTVFELAALGKPSILVPYPHATNQHQKTNAMALVEAGGAEMVLQEDLTASRLADCLVKYMEDRGALKKMGQRVRALGRPHAAREIVDHLEPLMGGRFRPQGSGPSKARAAHVDSTRPESGGPNQNESSRDESGRAT